MSGDGGQVWGGGGGVRVDVNKELKFLRKLKKKFGGGGYDFFFKFHQIFYSSFYISLTQVSSL